MLYSRTTFFEIFSLPFDNGKAIIGQADGRPQRVCRLDGAIGFQSESEAGDSAWDSDRLVADHGGFFVEFAIFSDVHVAGGFTWSHFAIIQEGGFAVGQANQHEAPAANVARGGVAHSKRGSQ